MTKPREFWISCPPQDNQAMTCYVWGFETKEPTTHVREVLPIDWEKVWLAFDGKDFHQLKELVEKALAGELK